MWSALGNIAATEQSLPPVWIIAIAQTVQLYSAFPPYLAPMADPPKGTDGVDRWDLGELLRGLRRQADLSQRELAERAGVPHSTVARIEAGSADDPKFRTVERLVRAAGAALEIRGDGGHQAPECPDGGQRDAAGRHYPAHLDVREVLSAKDWSGAWWAHWYDLPRKRWPVAAPERTFDLDREQRDWRRRRQEMQRQVTVRRVDEEVPPNGWHLVAVDAGGAVVGELCAYLRRSRDDSVSEVVLDSIEVLPQWRRLGIGTLLVEELRAAAVEVAVTTIRADVIDEQGMQFLNRCHFIADWRRLCRLTLTVRQA